MSRFHRCRNDFLWEGYLLLAFLLGILSGCVGSAKAPSPIPEIPPQESPPSLPSPLPVDAALPNIPFTIQLGAFSTVERAATLADRLKSEGIDAYYFIDSDGFSKVRFGRFLLEETARDHAEELRSQGAIDAYFIVHPRAVDPLIDSQEALRENIVRTALRFIGTPYRWGGSSVKSGFDCSGLTMTVYRLNGFELPRNAFSQYRAGLPVAKSALVRGDLVFFRTGRSSRVSHVGIYSGDDQFIHAPGKGKRIRVASLSNAYFHKRFTGARRYF